MRVFDISSFAYWTSGADEFKGYGEQDHGIQFATQGLLTTAAATLPVNQVCEGNCKRQSGPEIQEKQILMSKPDGAALMKSI